MTLQLGINIFLYENVDEPFSRFLVLLSCPLWLMFFAIGPVVYHQSGKNQTFLAYFSHFLSASPPHFRPALHALGTRKPTSIKCDQADTDF